MARSRAAIEASCRKPYGGSSVGGQPWFIAFTTESRSATHGGDVFVDCACKMSGDGRGKQAVAAAANKAKGALRARGDRVWTCSIVLYANGRNESSGGRGSGVECMKSILK